MPWGYAAAAVGGALISANASKKAGQTQARAAEQATEQERAMYDITRGDLSPWKDSGQMSLQKLSYLMGIDPGQGRKFGQAAPAPTSPMSFGTDMNQPLFNVNGRPAREDAYEIGGVPTVNEERYASDPVYKAAWDQHLANHQAQYGSGYDGSSDQMALAQGLKNLIAKERTARGLPSEQEQLASQQTAMQNDPNFGVLNKPFSLADFQESPAYQFNLNEGRKAIEKAAASRGTFYAPSTLQDIGKYSQGVASNEFNTAYGQYNQNMKNIWDRLYALSGTGQNAAAQTGAFGTTVGGQIGENLIGAGNAQAAGIMGGANAFTGAMGQGYNAYMMNQILANNQRGATGGGGGGGGVPMSSLTGGPNNDSWAY